MDGVQSIAIVLQPAMSSCFRFIVHLPMYGYEVGFSLAKAMTAIKGSKLVCSWWQNDSGSLLSAEMGFLGFPFPHAAGQLAAATPATSLSKPPTLLQREMAMERRHAAASLGSSNCVPWSSICLWQKAKIRPSPVSPKQPGRAFRPNRMSSRNMSRLYRD